MENVQGPGVTGGEMAAQTGQFAEQALNQIRGIAFNMTGWLKFLGIINIIQGALAAITIVGIVFAWLPIWLGILLFQAGNRATTAHIANNPTALVDMMNKLKLYFIIQGILIIVVIAFVILGMVFMGTSLFSIMQQFNY